MAQIPYYSSPALVGLCQQLGLTQYYETVGDLTVFTAANYQAAVDAINDMINTMLDDDDLDNDETAFGYQDTLDAGYSEIYWSTEGHFWY